MGIRGLMVRVDLIQGYAEVVKRGEGFWPSPNPSFQRAPLNQYRVKGVLYIAFSGRSV
jgi:hypothetical protein